MKANSFNDAELVIHLTQSAFKTQEVRLDHAIVTLNERESLHEKIKQKAKI